MHPACGAIEALCTVAKAMYIAAPMAVAMLQSSALPLTAWTVIAIVTITVAMVVTAAVAIAHSLVDTELVAERSVEVLAALIAVFATKPLITDADAHLAAAAVLAARWVDTRNCTSRAEVPIVTVAPTVACASPVRATCSVCDTLDGAICPIETYVTLAPTVATTAAAMPAARGRRIAETVTLRTVVRRRAVAAPLSVARTEL